VFRGAVQEWVVAALLVLGVAGVVGLQVELKVLQWVVVVRGFVAVVVVAVFGPQGLLGGELEQLLEVIVAVRFVAVSFVVVVVGVAVKTQVLVEVHVLALGAEEVAQQLEVGVVLGGVVE